MAFRTISALLLLLLFTGLSACKESPTEGATTTTNNKTNDNKEAALLSPLIAREVHLTIDKLRIVASYYRTYGHKGTITASSGENQPFIAFDAPIRLCDTTISGRINFCMKDTIFPERASASLSASVDTVTKTLRDVEIYFQMDYEIPFTRKISTHIRLASIPYTVQPGGCVAELRGEELVPNITDMGYTMKSYRGIDKHTGEWMNEAFRRLGTNDENSRIRIDFIP